MAALFYKYNGGSLFKNSIGAGQVSFCSLFDQFNSTGSNLAIITDISVRGTDTVQFFQTFDDIIHYYYYGKGLGSITFNMLFFCDCSGHAPGLIQLGQVLGSARGKKTIVTMGNLSFVGVMTDFSISVVAEPETYYAVSVNLGMIDHNLPKPNNLSSPC